MTTPVIAFFNNKGGVGKTSLVFHLASMYSDRGLRVVAADLDPQGNLTAAFIDENRLETLFEKSDRPDTIFHCLQPLMCGVGDIAPPHLEPISSTLALIVGDMALSTFEDQLSEAWPRCLAGDERAFRVTSAFWRILQLGASAHTADVVLIDLGPNLGAINRAALIAADHVVIPLGPDLFSLQGLRTLGPAIRQWRGDWKDRLSRNPDSSLPLPTGSIKPAGYIVLQNSIRLDRPAQASERWMKKIPSAYQEAVLERAGPAPERLEDDGNCIAKLKDYRSLVPLAQEARKAIFYLTPADGALGAHTYAVKKAYADFLEVSREIAHRAKIKQPSP